MAWRHGQQRAGASGFGVGARCDPRRRCAANGNPAGSLTAETRVGASLVGNFESSVDFESPSFEAAAGGVGTLRLERAFSPGSLLSLSPRATFTASLVDHTDGTAAQAIAATVGGPDEAFIGEAGPASLLAGHTYSIAIDTRTSSTQPNVGQAGSIFLRFDNVALAGPVSADGGANGNAGQGGKGGGSGQGGVNADKGVIHELDHGTLLRILRRHSVRSAVALRGRRLFVKVNCPGRLGRACHIVARGMLTKHRAVTGNRVVKVGRGKARRIVLRVERWAMKKLARRRRLVVRERVRAGDARATIYENRGLVRR